MKLPANVPERIERAARYGRDLARLNVPSVLMKENLPEELEDMVDRHLIAIVGQIREKSDMSIDGMEDAIRIIIETTREAFVDEVKAMLLAHTAQGGHA